MLIPIQKIDALLPQTQCTQCGFDGCMPYATAIAEGRAEINQCPPGGEMGIRKLANLLGVAAKPLNAKHGVTKPLHLAIIDEARCIGCTLCIRACPVDAIIGANKLMHSILSDECTGCELCIAPCPVDCISMRPVGDLSSAVDIQQRADRWRARHAFHTFRLARDETQKTARLPAKKPVSVVNRQASIQAAIERAQTKNLPAQNKK